MTASATILPPGESSRQGAQQPRIRHVPDYTFSAGSAAIDLAARVGLHLDPWEQLVLIDALGERPDGKWAAFEVGLNVPRQNGKGAVLEARELAGLFLFDEELIIHSAHEQKTATGHFRRMLNLINSDPEFKARVAKAPQGKGAEAIELEDGRKINFQTRTGGAGRGLTGDLVVLDEAMIIPSSTMAALVPTMAARSVTGNPQMWYAGSAVDQEKHEHGITFARVRERGINRVAGRLAYFEWSTDGDDPERVPEDVAGDPETWAEANPGQGIRISEEYIGDERAALGAREFAVERLGIGDWPSTSPEQERLIPADVWAACAEADPANRIRTGHEFAVDVNPSRSSAAIGVAGVRADGLRQLAVVDHAPGIGWVVSRCVELKAAHPRASFVVDRRGPAAVLIDDMKAAGLDVVEIDGGEYGRACGKFFDDVTQRAVRYPSPQPELDAALSGAKTAPLGDAWKWSRKSSTVDITPLVAVTLALWRSVKPKRSKVPVSL